MNLKQTKRLLKKYDITPRYRLGQNFLIDEGVLKRQVEYADLKGRDVVLEVGAGLGSLTEFLLEKARKVIVIEKDKRMVEVLEDRFKDEIEIIEGDAVKVAFPVFDRLVSNIPYSISSPLTFKLFKTDFKMAVITYQEEFARRLVAGPGERDYSRISVASDYHADIEIIETLPPETFYPAPEVGSAIVRIVLRKPPFEVDEKRYFKLVTGLFIHKKKTVRKALLHSFEMVFNKKLKKEERAEFIRGQNLPKSILEKRVFGLTSKEIAGMVEVIEW